MKLQLKIGKCCDHVINLENYYWNVDNLQEEIDPVVINAYDSDSD